MNCFTIILTSICALGIISTGCAITKNQPKATSFIEELPAELRSYSNSDLQKLHETLEVRLAELIDEYEEQSHYVPPSIASTTPEEAKLAEYQAKRSRLLREIEDFVSDISAYKTRIIYDKNYSYRRELSQDRP